MRKIVKTKWVVNVPEGAKTEIKEGQKLKKGDVLFVWMAGVSSRVSMLAFLSHLSKDKWDEIRKECVGKDYKVGELMMDKIESPRNGRLKELDEFGNMEFVERLNEEEVVSPMKAKVLKIEADKISLEFRALEIKGEPIVEGKAWGEIAFEPIEIDTQMTFKNRGEIVMLEKLERHMVLKSEVVGVSGILTVSGDFEGDSEVPILKIGQADWDFLSSKKVKDKKDALLSSKNSRILIVVE